MNFTGMDREITRKIYFPISFFFPTLKLYTKDYRKIVFHKNNIFILIMNYKRFCLKTFNVASFFLLAFFKNNKLFFY